MPLIGIGQIRESKVLNFFTIDNLLVEVIQAAGRQKVCIFKGYLDLVSNPVTHVSYAHLLQLQILDLLLSFYGLCILQNYCLHHGLWVLVLGVG